MGAVTHGVRTDAVNLASQAFQVCSQGRGCTVIGYACIARILLLQA